jgi:hypothetical protein
LEGEACAGAATGLAGTEALTFLSAVGLEADFRRVSATTLAARGAAFCLDVVFTLLTGLLRVVLFFFILAASFLFRSILL